KRPSSSRSSQYSSSNLLTTARTPSRIASRSSSLGNGLASLMPGVSLSFSDRSQRLLRRLQMRDVDHFAVDADRTDARIGGEGFDNAARMRDFGFRGRVAAVDRPNLVGMDRHAAEETVAARAAASAFDPIEIAKIGVDRVDRRDIG